MIAGGYDLLIGGPRHVMTLGREGKECSFVP